MATSDTQVPPAGVEPQATAPLRSSDSRPVKAAGRSSLLERMFAPIDIGLLVFFRVAFGTIMLWEATRFLVTRPTGGTWIDQKYIDPQWHFTYYGFSWVKPWAGNGMYLHFYALAALAACIAAGAFYRVATTLFFLGFTYVFLLEQTEYLNHFYMLSMVSLVMIFLPANRAYSVDAWRKPQIHSWTTPAWTLWTLRFLLGIVYFYGGIAKLNADWFQGEPMRLFLADRGQNFGTWQAWLTSESAVWAFTWGGLAFDLLIVPLLLWRRTLVPAIIAAFAFHATNNMLFHIGIFPWIMAFATLLFCPPDWCKVRPEPQPEPESARGKKRNRDNAAATVEEPPAPPVIGRREKITAAVLGVFVTFQLLFPLRHFLYPGNVSWTEEGHRFAWHMKLRIKTAARSEFTITDQQGNLLEMLYVDTEKLNQGPNTEEFSFIAVDPTGQRVEPLLNENTMYNRQVRAMLTKPDMLLQFCHMLADAWQKQRGQDVRIYARSDVVLNGRQPQPLVDTSVDLAAQPRNLWHADWIVPLTAPLNPEPPTSNLPKMPGIEQD